MIGRWQCRVSEAGKPESSFTASYEWLYGGKVLKETVTGPEWSGEFFTTYDPKSNTFKGVAAMSSGGYVVWENGGMTDGHASELGFVFGDQKMHNVSRTTTDRISDTHYVIRDFMPDTPNGPGKPTDSEDCTKIVGG